MSGIVSLQPLDGGEIIKVPDEKTVIGRGTFLQVSDKRVSRSHATIEINNGKLVIVPTHTNPCFYKHKGNGPQLVLAKDKPKTLEEGDVLSLLPDKLFFKIIYENKKKNNSEESDGENGEVEEIEDKDDSPKNKKVKPISKRNGGSVEPTPKKSKNSVQKIKPTTKVLPLSRRRLNKRAHSGEESEEVPEVADDGDDADYQEEDDDDEDYGKKRKLKPKKKITTSSSSKKSNGRATRRRSRNDEEDEDGVQRKRRPRAAAQKRPRYTDDDFVMSDEEFEIEEAVDDAVEEKQDSDFVAEEDDSGSDWGSKKKPSAQKTGKKKVGRGNGSRRKGSDSEMSEESVDDYLPRSRRGRTKQNSDHDDGSDEDYKNKSKASSNKKPGRKSRKMSDEEVTTPVTATPKGRRGRKPKLAVPEISIEEPEEEKVTDESQTKNKSIADDASQPDPIKPPSESSNITKSVTDDEVDNLTSDKVVKSIDDVDKTDIDKATPNNLTNDISVKDKASKSITEENNKSVVEQENSSIDAEHPVEDPQAENDKANIQIKQAIQIDLSASNEKADTDKPDEKEHVNFEDKKPFFPANQPANVDAEENLPNRIEENIENNLPAADEDHEMPIGKVCESVKNVEEVKMDMDVGEEPTIEMEDVPEDPDKKNPAPSTEEDKSIIKQDEDALSLVNG